MSSVRLRLAVVVLIPLALVAACAFLPNGATGP